MQRHTLYSLPQLACKASLDKACPIIHHDHIAALHRCLDHLISTAYLLSQLDEHSVSLAISRACKEALNCAVEEYAR